MSQSSRQSDLFANHPPPASQDQAALAASMPTIVRPRLAALLAEIRAATKNPWTPERTRVHAHLVHNMANWLPPPERDAIRTEFRNELARLGISAPAP